MTTRGHVAEVMMEPENLDVATLMRVLTSGYRVKGGRSKTELVKAGMLLAARVGAVMAEAGKRHADEGYDAATRNVVRLLNGEAKPLPTSQPERQPEWDRVPTLGDFIHRQKDVCSCSVCVEEAKTTAPWDAWRKAEAEVKRLKSGDAWQLLSRQLKNALAAGNLLWKHEIENDSQPSESLQALLDNWRDAALAPAQPEDRAEIAGCCRILNGEKGKP
jgi:hypothetical protein